MNNEELQNKIEELERKVLDLEENRLSFPLDKNSKDVFGRTLDEILPNKIYEINWDSIFYTSEFASLFTTTTSTSEDLTLREPDTSEGKKFRPDRKSRFRTSFYLNSNQDKSTVYICSPVTYGALSLSATTVKDSNFEWVAAKIVSGALSLAYWNGTTETTVATDITITDDSTHILEIDYAINSSVFYFDNKPIGSIQHGQFDASNLKTFYPYLVSVKSNDGTEVNFTFENIEFSQKRFISEKI